MDRGLEVADLHERGGGVGRGRGGQARREGEHCCEADHPSVNGSRVAPDVSIQIERVSVYSRSTSSPFSRPMPLAPKPPNGTLGPTTR